MRKLGDIFQDKSGQCRGNTNLIFIHSTQLTKHLLITTPNFLTLYHSRENERRSFTVLIYLCHSWARMNFSLLAQVYWALCTTLCTAHCTPVLCPPLRLATDWDCVTLLASTVPASIWPSHPDNNTQPPLRETPPTFKCKVTQLVNIYILRPLSLYPAPATPCLPDISQE